MAATFDLLIRRGTVVNHDGIGERDIGMSDGRIAALGNLSHADAAETIDARGLTILPGVIDTQVHFREPGAEHKEDLESGSRAAVLGGVTAVFEMPNTSPPTTNAEALADKLSRARGRMHCDHAFWLGGTHDNVDQIPELERLPGAAGIKVFMGSSTGDLLVPDDDGIRRILACGAIPRQRFWRLGGSSRWHVRPAPRSTFCTFPRPRRCASLASTRTLLQSR
jgi:dihydroorotase